MKVTEYPTGKWAEWEESELLELKPGTKLIFVRNSGVMSGRPGDVVTFVKLHMDRRIVDNVFRDYPSHFQCQELLDVGKLSHNFSFDTVALFDETDYPEYRPLTTDILKQIEKDFIEKW